MLSFHSCFIHITGLYQTSFNLKSQILKRSKQVIDELSGLSKLLKELTKGGRAEEFQLGLGAKGNYIFVL